MRWLAATLACAIVLVGGRGARANGRYPSALNIQVGPGDRADTIVLPTTFGMVYSTDTGRHWHWACEFAVGFESTWDPTAVITSDGSFVVSLPDGLTLAATDGCSYTRPSSAPNTEVVDLATDPASGVVAAAVNPLGQPNGVAVSTDNGRTWHMGWSLAMLLIDAIEVAPNHPQRMYAVGYANGSVPTFYRSDDEGMTFTPTTNDFRGGYDAYIAGVDPTNPDVVYVRSDASPQGTLLLRSTDAGATFQILTRTSDRMKGFAMTPDGQTLWVASTGPEGVERSDDRGATFQSVGSHFVPLCLRYQAGVLYACVSLEYDGYLVAQSTDLGMHFSPLLGVADLHGPDGCGAGTPVGMFCADRWRMVSSQLPSPDAGPRGDAALVDVASDIVVDAPHDAIGPMDAVGAEPPRVRGGCGCSTASPTDARTLATASVVGLVLVVNRSRRRRARGPITR